VGSVATSLWFVNDTKSSAVWAKTTVGARPDGLKLAPLIVIRLFVEFTTALKIIGAVAHQAGAATNMDAITNDVVRKCLGNWDILLCRSKQCIE
jgi:L-2-hydroxyglutarate oxidase LhgO